MNQLARQPCKLTRDGMAQVLHPRLRIARHHIRPLRSSRAKGRRGSGARNIVRDRSVQPPCLSAGLSAGRRAVFSHQSEEERFRNASSFRPPPTVGCWMTGRTCG